MYKEPDPANLVGYLPCPMNATTGWLSPGQNEFSSFAQYLEVVCVTGGNLDATSVLPMGGSKNRYTPGHPAAGSTFVIREGTR